VRPLIRKSDDDEAEAMRQGSETGEDAPDRQSPPKRDHLPLEQQQCDAIAIGKPAFLNSTA
jgi:hypothetical protein